MKGAALLWGGLALIVVVLGGLLIYRSTAPNGDVVPVGESSLEEESAAAPESQFLQLEPSTVPPLEGEDSETAADGSTTTNNDAAPLANPASTGEAVTISMTDTGFVPATVTIDAGTTVMFVNNGQALHWPASDVHPTHEILSAFDSQRGVPTGDTYAYTFTEAGSWNFHDHLNPQFTGTVTVE
jgi:plastocyanin